MNLIETERREVVNVVMNILFQKYREFLASLRTFWFLQKHSAAWHCINTTPCRLLEGRKQFLEELTAILSCYRFSSSVPSVSIPPSNHLYYVTSNPWCCQCHVPTNIDLLLYSKTVQLLRRPFTGRASDRHPIASCRNRGAATAVPTVCSENTSILHHISAFIC